MSKEVVTDKGISGVVGKNNFFPAETVIKKWNIVIKEHRTDHDLRQMQISEEGINLKYHMETLKNLLGDSTWFLIYDLGFSLKDILVILGSNFKGQPRHRPDNNWWISYDESHWTNRREEPNYYLLKTAGIHKNEEWTVQESKIVSDELNLQRVSTRLMMNSSITCFLSKKSHLHEHCHHWGPEPDSGMVRCASHFDGEEFTLFNWGERSPEGRLGTFVVKKFDF